MERCSIFLCFWTALNSVVSENWSLNKTCYHISVFPKKAMELFSSSKSKMKLTCNCSSEAELSEQHQTLLTGQVLVWSLRSKRGCVRPCSLFLLCRICCVFPCEEGSPCILSQGSPSATSQAASVQRLKLEHTDLDLSEVCKNCIVACNNKDNIWNMYISSRTH